LPRPATIRSVGTVDTLLALYAFALLALIATAVLTAYLLPPDEDL